MGYIIGGIACALYAILVYYIAIQKPPKMISLVKKKLGKKSTDKAAVIVCYIFGTLGLAGAIVLFVLAPPPA